MEHSPNVPVSLRFQTVETKVSIYMKQQFHPIETIVPTAMELPFQRFETEMRHRSPRLDQILFFELT